MILLWLPTRLNAAIYDPILDQIKPDTITLIGETHKKVESVELFQSLVLAVTEDSHCVVIGLEIASDQQANLDAIIEGRAAVEKIALWPQVDHLSYRRMLGKFAELKQQGQCLKMVAIDAGMDNVIDRDLWMALSLAGQVGDAPVLVLLGALHTLKRVNWKNTSSRPSVAELLIARGFSVKSYPQRWLPEQCRAGATRTSSFVGVNSPRALNLLNNSLLSLLNAKSSKTATGVVDGFVVWECRI